MQRTNYHLFDFLDFDPTFSRDEALYKAYPATDIHADSGDIVLTVAYQRQKRQADMEADTTAAPELHELRLRAYGASIVRLFTSIVGDAMSDESPMLALSPTLERMPLGVEREGDTYIIKDSEGRMRARLETAPYPLESWSDLQPAPQPTLRLTLYPDGELSKPVALSDDHFSPPRYDALPLSFCRTEGTADRATMSVKCEPNECFAGTGERFRKMDLAGQTFFLRNQDAQGVNNRRAYKNIPFYLSSRMYGLFLHTSDYCRLSLADHSTRSVQLRNDRATIDAFVIGGATPERVLYHYRELTGFPPMLPLWSFGIWMSRMTYFSAEEVEAICERLRREHYPCDVIHLDTGWFRTDWLCEWKFNPERFPDPEAFLRRLAERGFKVSLWQLPYVAKGAEQIAEAREHRYIGQLLKEQASEGSNFSTLDYAGTIDFTYPAATEWYKGLLRRLLSMGVKSIKTDFGENIHMEARYHALPPERLNNIYALLYQRAAFEVTKEVTGDGIVWARAAWAGCQRYPLHWGGDAESSWNGLAGSLRGGLHFGLSGFAFWSHDIPGFHSEPDFMNSPLSPELYVRWTQFGVFSSHMRYHGTHAREPWLFPTVADIVKRWWRLRYRLMPYIVEESREATRTGLPMVAALLIHHPTDRTVWHIDDEYYFGRHLLVAPVMNARSRRDIYLPEGEWVNIFTSEHFCGPKWLKDVEVPLDQMPVFAHPGTQIPVYEGEVESTDDIDFGKCKYVKI